MKSRNIVATLLLLVALLFNFPAHSKTYVLSPEGEFKSIDVKLQNDTIDALNKGSVEEKEKTIQKVLASPEKYAPPVFYIMSNILFDQNKKDDAAFWFYAGQLRGRYDANRCADISAREAIAVLNQQFGAPINKYMFQNIPKLKALVPKVIEWDKKTAHDYDNRWINLHGMDAINASLNSDEAHKAMSLPKDQWEQIAENTRATYLSGFNEVMEQMQSQKK